MKALITLSFVVDTEEAEALAGIGEKMERGAIESLAEKLSEHGFDLEDLDGILEFYGASVTVRQELEAA